MKINLTPDYCCGGGHCGPMPGYFFICPECNLESNCRTTYELEVGQQLTCFACKTSFKAENKHDDFCFDFSKV